MSNPGWYPDPGGAPGQYRYWDGSTWSPTTAPRPDGSPDQTPGRPTPAPKRRTGLIVGIAIALVVIIIGTVFAVRFLRPPEIIDQDPVPTSSPLTETPPSPPPTVTVLPTPRPTTEPSASPATPGPSEPTPTADAPCPAGNPVFRQDHPSDGRVHGGGLSFPKLSGYGSTQSQSAFTWAYDMDGQEKAIVEGWNSLYAVGAVATFDGFEEPKIATQLVLKCTLTSTLYQTVISQKRLASKAITVDGHRGWSLRTEIRIDNPQVQIAGDILEIIVVDTGSPESLSMFWACIPIDEPGNLKQLNTTIKNLRAEV